MAGCSWRDPQNQKHSGTKTASVVGAHWVCAVTNYYTRGGLKQRKFIVSQSGGQESKTHVIGPKSRCCQGRVPCDGSRGHRPCSLPAPDGCGIPWLMACHGRLCLIFTAFPSVYLCELFLCLYFFLGTLVTWITQVNLILESFTFSKWGHIHTAQRLGFNVFGWLLHNLLQAMRELTKLSSQ